MRCVVAAALRPVDLPWSLLTWPALLVPPLFFRPGDRDGALLLCVVGGTLAGLFAPRGPREGIRAALPARALAGVAGALGLAALLAWSPIRISRSWLLFVHPFLVAFAVAAATAAHADGVGEERVPWRLAAGLFLGALVPIHAIARGSTLLAALGPWLLVPAALGLVVGRDRRGLPTLLCFATMALASPRRSSHADFLRDITGVRWLDGFPLALGLGILFAAGFLFAWLIASRGRRRPAGGTLVERAQRAPWTLALLIAAAGAAVFLLRDARFKPRWWRAPPGLRMLLWGTLPVLLAFFAHVTANAHGLLRRSAGFAVIPLALALPIVRVALGRAHEAIPLLAYTSICFWALVSRRLVRARHVSVAGPITAVVVLLGAFYAGGLDHHLKLSLHWVFCLPVAFHALVVSRITGQWILRLAFLLGALAGVLAASAPRGNWFAQVEGRLGTGLAVAVGVNAAGLLVLAARRFRASSPLPPGHPILSDYEAHPD